MDETNCYSVYCPSDIFSLHGLPFFLYWCRNVSIASHLWKVWVRTFLYPFFLNCFPRWMDIMSLFCVSGRLSGVMDDRGKFIYISQEEMKAVADYIKRQGRVSISHLASKSNQFIDLEPKVQYSEDINIAEEITVNWVCFLTWWCEENLVVHKKRRNYLCFA